MIVRSTADTVRQNTMLSALGLNQQGLAEQRNDAPARTAYVSRTARPRALLTILHDDRDPSCHGSRTAPTSRTSL